MKDISKLKDYRKKFRRYYGIEFDSKKYHIHHIDLNRENNDIKNLMIMPKRLHERYHWYLNSLGGFMEDKTTFTLRIDCKISGTMNPGYNSNQYMLEVLRELVDVLEECREWLDFKYYLDGYLPNIHNIRVEVK